MKLKHYYIFDDIAYIPIHLNIITENKFNSILIEKSLFDEISEFITSSSHAIYVIDMKKIKAAARIFENCDTSIFKKQICFINVEDSIKHKLSENEIKSFVNECKQSICTHNALNNLTTFIKSESKEHDLNMYFEKKLKTLLITYIRDQVKYFESPKLLHSSSLYANAYINIKDLFYSPSNLIIAIYMLCEKLSKIPDDYILISASNTGGVLANLISLIMEKDVLFLRNIGPKLRIQDKKLFDDIIPDKKYIYIYDFLCMGTELRIAEMLIKLKQSSLIKCVGIAEYRSYKSFIKHNQSADHAYTTEWDSIFNIIDESFNYQIFPSIELGVS